MKRSVFKIAIFSIVLFFAVLYSEKSSAQLQLLNKLTNPVNENDSSKIYQNISIDNVNKEIEFTDNLIAKENFSEISNEEQKSLIAEIDAFNTYIASEGKEFIQYEKEQINHLFLINARFSWTDYYKTHRNSQRELQKMIREIQEQQSYYTKNKNKWENSLPNLEKSLSVQITSHINSNLKKMDGIISDFDLKIRNLITAENKITQDIVLIDRVLRNISSLLDKRKSELFKQNEKNIFSIDYLGSYDGSFTDRLKVMFQENTKTLRYFYSTVKRILPLYLILLLFMVSYFLFIRKNYIKLKNYEDNLGVLRINRIIIQKPGLTLVAILLFLWTILVPYSPLFLNILIYLSTLVIILLILSPVMDPFIKKIEIAVIILLIIGYIEISAWYFGNFSRFYIMFESIVGIILTYKYVLPGFKVKEFINQNKQLILSVRIIILVIFICYTVAFISNIFGYINLTGYTLKFAVYTGMISLMVHGFYRITSSLIQASVDVLNVYYPEIVTKYGDSIVFKLNRFLKFVLGFLWISGILRISELYEFFSSKIIAFFTDKVTIGSLSFTPGNLLFFITVIYLTYIITNFTKRIIEREILAKREFKRGVAASISLTMRIFIVFFGTLIALSVSGLDLSKIGIIAGALSVGIGFGLQNIVSNFISGLILIYGKPVQEGDTIEVDSLLGRVSNIGIRASTVTTYNGAEVVVPNSNLISNQLINWTLSNNRKRIEVKVGTAYGTDPVQILEILLKAALSHEKVLPDPAPLPLFEGFGDSSLNFRLLFWVRFEDGLQTQSDVAIEVYKLFKEYKIEIPFPQLDLHIKEKKEKLSDDVD